MNRSRIVVIAILVGLVLLLTSLQLWISLESQRRSVAVLQDLEAVKTNSLADEKTRQDVIAERIDNEQKTIFLQNFLAGFSTTIGIGVALSGAWLGITQYLGIRRKEQEDRQKERLDRAATDFNTLWEGITKSDMTARAGSIAGLQQFLSLDKQEFHERVISALALVARMPDNNEVVQRTLTPVIEYAMRHISLETLRKVSWQGLSLRRANFAQLNLSGFDFRDCNFQEVDFRGAILRQTRFNATRFLGSEFDSADLSGANLEYADLASTSLVGANLEGANLRHIKVLHMDLKNAKLRSAQFSEQSTDWRLAKNWRAAEFDPSVKARLLTKYGPAVSGPRVLMLLWEFSPIISGGSWTAAYHLLKKLRARGADLIVMVPWPASAVSYYEFGNEIELIPLGKETATAREDGYSPYASLIAPSAPYLYDSDVADGQSMFDMINDFTRSALETIREKDLKFDLIHAHDWVTFSAAEAIGHMVHAPWVAHFHSTEVDRQTTKVNNAIARIERMACSQASQLIVPSHVTQQQLVKLYGATEPRITVAPNCLSDDGETELISGQFESARVVFLGRLSPQKGADLFVQIAKEVHRDRAKAEFVMYGRGELEQFVENNSHVEEDKIPAPQIVAPGDQHIEFEDVKPINFDPETNSIEPLGDYTRAKVIEIEKWLRARGFTAFAVPMDDDHTYRVAAKDSGDGAHLDYLVKANGLKRIQFDSQQIVWPVGFLEWQNRKKAFEGATLCLVPSRAEPFGMVILEAMQAGVPVLFAQNAGAGEVIKSGVRINPEDIEHTAQQVVAMLVDKEGWRQMAEAELAEIATYPKRDDELTVAKVWQQLAPGLDSQQLSIR